MSVKTENSVKPDRLLTQAWQVVCRKLATQVSRATYLAYVRSVRPLHLDRDSVTLGVASRFASRWLQDRYGEQIRASFEATLGRPIVVRYEVLPPDSTMSLLLDESQEISARPTPPIMPDRPSRRDSGWISQTALYPRFTFEEFVVGPGSRVAFSAAEAVAKSPGALYNPLYLHAASGRGKTHLLHAIGHRIRSLPEPLRVALTEGEAFSRHRRPDLIRDQLADTDVWLVDDVQLIASRGESLEEFFHLFNLLHRSGRQIVLASDRPPGGLQALDDRLRSRLESGLVTEIGCPELETRMAILERRASGCGAIIPMETIYFIANGVRSNVRALEGALTTLIGYCRFTGAEASIDSARAALADQLIESPAVHGARKGVSFSAVLEAVAAYYAVKVEDLIGPHRTQPLAMARQMAMFLGRDLTDRSYADIGRALGGRSHAPVHRGVKKVESLLETSAPARIAVQELRERLSR